MLVVIVQLLYDVIHQADYLIGQNRQIEANSDSQEHNGTDINRPVCVQVSIQLSFKSCINGIKPAVGGINKTVFPETTRSELASTRWLEEQFPLIV